MKNNLYLQEAQKGMQPSPPPAVTIPMDRVAPKYRRYDSEMGAPTTPAPLENPTPAPLLKPAVPVKKELLTPDFGFTPKKPS